MSADSSIGWTHHTFNPWWGCTEVSEGCNHCYAEAFAKRLGHTGKPRPSGKPILPILWGKRSARKPASEDMWAQPLAWDAAARAAGTRERVFCASMADVFEDRPDLIVSRRRLLRLIERCDGLDWLLLTKRPENMVRLAKDAGWTREWPAHVWPGMTVENQDRLAQRFAAFNRVPASGIKFLSCEPLLGPLDLDPPVCPDCDGFDFVLSNDDATPFCAECQVEMGYSAVLNPLNGGIGWVIVGSESGPGARPMDLAWARKIVDTCAEHEVPVFTKQIATPAGRAAGDAKGEDPTHWPDGTWPRQFPTPEFD